jgi:hypothetical protein
MSSKQKQITENDLIIFITSLILVVMWFTKNNIKSIPLFSFQMLIVILIGWVISSATIVALKGLFKLGILDSDPKLKI